MNATPSTFSAARTPPRVRAVLVIEDSALIRERLVELVHSCEGFLVTVQADTEAAAVAALQDHRFDAVVVDLQLREGSGFGVLQVLQQMQPRPLTMVLTNTATRAARQRCAALGVQHFFDKSYEFDRVALALDALRQPDHPGKTP
ncbi:response regulator [Caldimonas caldifontis]|uniref:Response regulator n=1 Tax=Caldimonas caldifontis TaxID=1452508 RepID=A0A2S5SUQ0_9BURK|nr:response regulator [Caldimonas caldifontis]PPE66287.1 response regulator [Caldimonas caldifontis]